MSKKTSTLWGLALALTVTSGAVVAHSFGSPGYGMQRGGMMAPGKFSDEYLDRLGEAMAERFRSMQAIASEDDAEARRELLREHFAGMHSFGQGKPGKSGKQGRGTQGQGMMGQGAMGYRPGMMGQGMMGYGPGMMGHGMMGPGMMMHYGQLSDEYLDLMGEHMAEQHARMARIAETSDKAERRELLREHFEAMREFMEEMHGS